MINKTEQDITKNWNRAYNSPLLSIKCLTYNHEKYIEQALDGFLMQVTNFPFIIVIHDDASKDKTSEIIKKYEENFPLIIKPIYEKENQYSKKDGSLTRIVNNALQGKYIAICEGDDYWTDSNKLQMQVDFLEKNPDYGFVLTDADIYYHAENQYDKAVYTNKKSKVFFGSKAINSSGYLLNTTWVIRHDLYDKCNENPMKTIDGALRLFYELNLITKGKILKSVTGVYRKAAGSASCFSDKDEKKEYEYIRSLFNLKRTYISKYPYDEKTYSDFYNTFVVLLMEKSFKYNDKETFDLLYKHYRYMYSRYKNLLEETTAKPYVFLYKIFRKLMKLTNLFFKKCEP